MYIQIKNNPDAPVLISRKLFKAMDFPKGRGPWFIQLSHIRDTDRFAIVKRSNADTFRTQCSMVTPTGDRRTPAQFMWTIPSLEYFLATTGTDVLTSKIIKVKKIVKPNITYFEICTR